MILNITHQCEEPWDGFEVLGQAVDEIFAHSCFWGVEAGGWDLFALVFQARAGREELDDVASRIDALRQVSISDYIDDSVLSAVSMSVTLARVLGYSPCHQSHVTHLLANITLRTTRPRIKL